MDYRLYLFGMGAGEGIHAADGFLATDDHEAGEIGAVLFRAVHDVFRRYEVWSGSRYVTGSPAPASICDLTLADLTEARLTQALELEERMASTFACVRRSQTLLAETDRLMASRNRRSIRARVDQNDGAID